MNETAAAAHRHDDFLGRSHQLYIGGQHVEPLSGRYFDVIDPATESVIAQAAEADAQDVDRAVSAAREAFERPDWAHMKPAERAQLLHRIADLIDRNTEELAYLETLDNGKPLAHSLPVDIPVSANAFRYYAGWADKIRGSTVNISMPGNYHSYTLREPVGVVGLIVPWNFPLVMAAMKLAPALAAGCTCILKPAEETSLTALRLAELLADAGLPDGVVNVITGLGETAGAAIAEHPGIDKVAFTGSTEVGKRIIRAASGNLKKVSLELGGKAPNIIFPDADLSKAIPGSAMSIFFNSGQLCTAASRLYVHNDIYDQVIDGIVEFSKTLKVGSGLEDDTQLGPLVSERQMKRVLTYIGQGGDEGGNIVAGGRQVGDTGYFVEPTVIANATNEMTVTKEEIFGPVLVAQSFGDTDEVVNLANDTDYGLSAVVWTKNVSDAHNLAGRLKAGLVSVNTQMAADLDLPIGGFKQSGWGRENGSEGLSLYLDTKSVVVALDD